MLVEKVRLSVVTRFVCGVRGCVVAAGAGNPSTDSSSLGAGFCGGTEWEVWFAADDCPHVQLTSGLLAGLRGVAGHRLTAAE